VPHTTNAITVTVGQDRATVALPGEHEAYSADKLTRSLTGLIDEGVSIMLDLREAAFVDSTVIGVLLSAARDAEARGLGFTLLLGDETGWPVRRLLEVTGLATQLDVVG
jgi:anti-anti-sigma factor